MFLRSLSNFLNLPFAEQRRRTDRPEPERLRSDNLDADCSGKTLSFLDTGVG